MRGRGKLSSFLFSFLCSRCEWPSERLLILCNCWPFSFFLSFLFFFLASFVILCTSITWLSWWRQWAFVVEFGRRLCSVAPLNDAPTRPREETIFFFHSSSWFVSFLSAVWLHKMTTFIPQCRISVTKKIGFIARFKVRRDNGRKRERKGRTCVVLSMAAHRLRLFYIQSFVQKSRATKDLPIYKKEKMMTIFVVVAPFLFPFVCARRPPVESSQPFLVDCRCLQTKKERKKKPNKSERAVPIEILLEVDRSFVRSFGSVGSGRLCTTCTLSLSLSFFPSPNGGGRGALHGDQVTIVSLYRGGKISVALAPSPPCAAVNKVGKIKVQQHQVNAKFFLFLPNSLSNWP